MLPFLNDDPSLDAGQPLDQLVWDQLEQSPNKVAIIDGARTLTYAQLRAQAEGVARGLLARGRQPGDRVLLHLENGLAFAEALMGTLLAGCVPVPTLDPRPVCASGISATCGHTNGIRASSRACFNVDSSTSEAKTFTFLSEMCTLCVAVRVASAASSRFVLHIDYPFLQHAEFHPLDVIFLHDKYTYVVKVFHPIKKEMTASKKRLTF